MLKIKGLSKWYLLAVFLSTVITAGIDLYSYEDVNYGTLYIQRQFGNEIKFNILFIVILFGFFATIRIGKIRKQKNLLNYLLLIGTVSLLVPNDKDIHLAVIGLVVIIKYTLLYYSIIHIYQFDNYKAALRKALEFVLIIESIGGFLQTFLGISIPFLTSRNVESYRGSMLRMTGTMLFSADFALIITFISAFFLCDYYFNKNKHAMKYILLCLFDLWFAGSRTMIIAAGIIFAYNFSKKYKNKPLYKVTLIALTVIVGTAFLYSGSFSNYFIAGSDNFLLMFSTRLVHWQMGINMIIHNPFLGVGLNNSVLYANTHPEIVREAYKISLEPMSFFFTNPIHSSIIIMFTELGIIGGVCYLLVFLEPIVKCAGKKICANKSDRFFIISEGSVLLIYALQGWGSLREHGMVLMVVFYAYYDLMKSKKVEGS